MMELIYLPEGQCTHCTKVGGDLVEVGNSQLCKECLLEATKLIYVRHGKRVRIVEDGVYIILLNAVCTCVDVPMGSHLASVKVELAEYDCFTDYKENISVDTCILPAIIKLWKDGIPTYGSCCGHGDLGVRAPWANILPHDVLLARALGYEVHLLEDWYEIHREQFDLINGSEYKYKEEVKR